MNAVGDKLHLRVIVVGLFLLMTNSPLYPSLAFVIAAAWALYAEQRTAEI